MTHQPAPCPENITDCSTDCPRYGRDCDGDEVVYVTGRVECEDSDDEGYDTCGNCGADAPLACKTGCSECMGEKQ